MGRAGSTRAVSRRRASRAGEDAIDPRRGRDEAGLPPGWTDHLDADRGAERANGDAKPEDCWLFP
jgi:hypothetical protein